MFIDIAIAHCICVLYRPTSLLLPVCEPSVPCNEESRTANYFNLCIEFEQTYELTFESIRARQSATENDLKNTTTTSNKQTKSNVKIKNETLKTKKNKLLPNNNSADAGKYDIDNEYEQ